jgi:two-component system chemotaxis response regulator CheY
MGKKVLTVDDSATIRQALNIALEGAGYDVVEATDGVDALRKLDIDRVDMVVTDLNMPNMNGVDLIREIRKQPGNRFTPVLMLTTESDNKRKQEGKAAGASGWIVKPFRPEQLLTVVQMVCPA